MKTVLTVILTLVGLQAHAQGKADYVGSDRNGQACSITIDAGNNLVSYWYMGKDGRDGYGFRLTQEFVTALKQGQSPISLNEGGVGGANLKIWINQDGTMDAKFSNLVVYRSSCENMNRQ